MNSCHMLFLIRLRLLLLPPWQSPDSKKKIHFEHHKLELLYSRSKMRMRNNGIDERNVFFLPGIGCYSGLRLRVAKRNESIEIDKASMFCCKNITNHFTAFVEWRKWINHIFHMHILLLSFFPHLCLYSLIHFHIFNDIPKILFLRILFTHFSWSCW